MNRNLPSLLATTFLLWTSYAANNCLAMDASTKTGTTPPVSTLTMCDKIDGKKLSINSACATTVKAIEPENMVGLEINSGEEYTVTVPEGQTWLDDKRPNTPPRGKEGSPIMNLFALLKKAKNSLWFALIAEIKGENKPYDLSVDSNFKPTGNGELVLYANDAKWFYWNNAGEILVEIHRKR